MYETLESRRLLSSLPLSIGCSANVMTIEGSDGDDSIAVSIRRADNSPDGMVIVTVDQHEMNVFRAGFESTALFEVQVVSRDGDDAIKLNNNDTHVHTRVWAGANNDSVEAFVSGRASSTLVYAGDGDDYVAVGNGRESEGGFTVYGETGNDIIHGSRFADMLFGDSDPMEGDGFAIDGGDDLIYAGAGDDIIAGGDGADFLVGEDGDDFFNGGEGRDVLDGGEGIDSAMADLSDVTESIEYILCSLTPEDLMDLPKEHQSNQHVD
jgi:Ca2+-binding RTX toxin-like protein